MPPRFLQPLNQGIVKSFKALYRKLLLTSLVANFDNFQSITEFLKSINVLGAVLWIADFHISSN
jgi:hypothetical protein